MMKKLFCVFACCAVLATATPSVALAGKPEASGAVVDDASLTPGRMATVEALTLAKEQALGISRQAGAIGPMSLNSYGLLTKSIPNYRQELDHFCGPASTRQTLAYHRTSSGSSTSLPSQTTLAGRIGTTDAGSSTSGIVSALNSYDGVFGNIYYLGSNIIGTSNPYETFVNRIGMDLRQPGGTGYWPTIPIILVATSKIPRYGGHISRHYITISGINDTVSPMKMRSVDPNSNSAYFGIYWDPVGSTTANGLCRACYQADSDGSNLAMCW